jgi:hypothetical protein
MVPITMCRAQLFRTLEHWVPGGTSLAQGYTDHFIYNVTTYCTQPPFMHEATKTLAVLKYCSSIALMQLCTVLKQHIRNFSLFSLDALLSQTLLVSQKLVTRSCIVV